MPVDDDNSTWGGVSRALHWGLGLTIIGMIIYGWWMNHIPARPDRFFYRAIHADEDWHIMAAYALLAIIVVHVAAAFYHHFIKRDDVTARMFRQLRPSAT